MPDPISWLIIIVCIILSFFFSASETALACCNRFKMQIQADEGKKSAKLVLKTCDKFDRALTTVLIGHNIVSIVASSIATVLSLKIFGEMFDESSISFVCSIVMAVIIYLLGDTLPKTIAKAIPDTLSLLFIYPITALMYVFYPVGLLFEKITSVFNKKFGIKPNDAVSEEEFENAIEKAIQDETIEEEQVEMVQSAFDFIDTRVSEVFTKRDDIFAINYKGLTHKSLQEFLIKTNYTRIPVYDKVLDNCIGILNVKVYVEEYNKDPHVDIRSILQRPYFVSPNIMINDLFEGFKRKHTHIALVRDNHKHIIGMVTMEDVLEELVEDISEPSSRKAGK